MASLSSSGFAPMSRAIAGSEVAITVESMFSMNRATATISGTIRLESMGGGGPWWFGLGGLAGWLGPGRGPGRDRDRNRNLRGEANRALRRRKPILNDIRVTGFR